MGRVVPAGLLAGNEHVQQGLARSAAARASSLDLDAFNAKLQVSPVHCSLHPWGVLPE